MRADPHDPFSTGPTHPPVRVLVVDAPAAQRESLIALLATDPGCAVVGWASDAASAAHAAASLKPDIILIGAPLPASDAVRITQRIMRETPVPIVAISLSPDHPRLGGADAVLAAGALAVVRRPPSGADGAALTATLLRTVKSMAEVRVVRRWAPERPGTTRRTAARMCAEVIAIGASTGGPQVLEQILTHLPATFSAPVLVVQHIAPPFAASLVDWLTPRCALPLALARAGSVLDRPGIHIAPPGQHLVVHGRTLALTDDPPVRGHRPSATILFRSVAAAYGANAVGVLLSGMGDDGAAGLYDLKNAGGTTIAQDEATSVVFGMPAVAIALGAVDHVLPPVGMAPLLIDLTQAGRRE